MTRTQELIYNVIFEALKNTTPEGAKGWFKSCEYVASYP